MDPDQTAPIGAVSSEPTLFVEMAHKTFQQTTKADKFSCDWCFKGLNHNRLTLCMLGNFLLFFLFSFC